MEDQRHAAGGFQVVEHEAQALYKHATGHADRLRDLADWVRQVECHGTGRQRGKNGVKFSLQIWKGAAARLVGRAVRDQFAHGVLRGFGELKWLLRRGGRNTREGDGPHMPRMLPKILERGLCPVGTAIQIDPRISECCADVVEIVHCDRRRVEPHIGNGRKRLAAGTYAVDGEQIPEGVLESTSATEAAREPIRVPGSR